MAPGSSIGRVWLPLFALLAILALVLWPPQEESPQETPPEVVVEENLPEAADPLVAEAADASASVQREEVASEELSGLDPEVPPEQQLAVRVWISTKEDGQPVSPPEDVEQWTAVAQTWLRDTNETFRFEVPFSRQGMAAFVFLEDTHVDWVAAIPPANSKYGLMTYEGHDDYSPGDQDRRFFTVGPGGTLQGKIIDHMGNPIGGVPVELMHDSGAALDFTPGFFSVLSQSDGRFEFRPVQSDRMWTVAVRPGDYLMLKPTLDELGNGRGMAHVPPGGGTVSVGTLQVMPGASVALNVTDSQGVGVPAVDVSIRPRSYEGSFLRQPDWEGDVVVLDPFSSDSASAQAKKQREAREASAQPSSGREDPYLDNYYFRTNRAGRAMLHLPPGEYRLYLSDFPGEDGEQEMFLDFSTRQPTVHMTIPATLGTIRGKLLDEQDRPLAFARLWLETPNDDISLNTNSKGEFLFEKLPIGEEYTLRVLETKEQEVLAAHIWRPVPNMLDESQEYRVQRGYRLGIHIATADGKPVKNGRVALLNWQPNPGDPPPLNPDWFNLMRRDGGMNRRGYASFSGLLPGTLEVALLLPVGTGEFDAEGRALVTWEEHQRWFAQVDGTAQKLTADLSTYSPPAHQQTRHVITALNQDTGKNVGPSRLRLAMTDPYFQSGATSKNGRFVIDMRRGDVEVEILVAGYRPWRGTFAGVDGPTAEHEVRMIPEDTHVVIQLRDRDGKKIPDGPVALEDLQGQPVRADVNPGRIYPRLRSNAVLKNSQVNLAMVPAGTLVVRLSNYGDLNAVAIVEIPRAPAGQVLTANLDWSLQEWQSALEQGYQR